MMPAVVGWEVSLIHFPYNSRHGRESLRMSVNSATELLYTNCIAPFVYNEEYSFIKWQVLLC